MSNCENCAFTEFLPNGILNEVVRLQINGRSGLIEDKDLRFAQQGSGQTNELPLTNWQIFATLINLVIEAVPREVRNKGWKNKEK